MQVSRILELIRDAPPWLVRLIYDLVKAIVTSEDPERAAKRAIKAAASKRASEALLARLLARRAR